MERKALIFSLRVDSLIYILKSKYNSTFYAVLFHGLASHKVLSIREQCVQSQTPWHLFTQDTETSTAPDNLCVQP